MDQNGSTLRLDAAGRSDIGAVPRRSGRGEEDSQCVRRLARSAEQGVEKWLCAVADGVGQRKGGSVASAQALNMLEDAVERYARWGTGYLDQFDEGMRTAEDYHRFVAQCIDSQLRQNAENNVSISGMATTLTAAYCEGTVAHLLHVGDSRAYRLDARGGVLTQLTRDDAPAQDAEFDPEPTSALGALADIAKVQTECVELTEGDILLLCTDGLWREVEDALLVRILRGSATPAAAVDRLIRVANRSGGRGNIAVVVLHVGAPPVQEDPDLDKEYPLSQGLATDRGPQRPMPLPRPEEAPVAPPPPSTATVPTPPATSAPSPTPVVAAPEAGADGGQAGLAFDVPEPLPISDTAVAGPVTIAAQDSGPAVPDPFGPRAALSRREPPEVPGAGPFFWGMLAGVGVCVVIGGLIFAGRWALGVSKKPKPEAASTAARSEEELGTPTSSAVALWEKPISNAPATVSYLTGLNPETGEEQYDTMNFLGPGDLPEPVTLFQREDGVYLYLRVRYALNPQTREPMGDFLTFIFKPELEQRDSVEVKPGSAVPKDEKPNGEIVVESDQPATVSLRALQASEDLIKGGQVTAKLKKSPDGSTYRATFKKVPCGAYSVGSGTDVKTASITTASPRPEAIRFSSAP